MTLSKHQSDEKHCNQAEHSADESSSDPIELSDDVRPNEQHEWQANDYPRRHREHSEQDGCTYSLVAVQLPELSNARPNMQFRQACDDQKRGQTRHIPRHQSHKRISDLPLPPDIHHASPYTTSNSSLASRCSGLSSGIPAIRSVTISIFNVLSKRIFVRACSGDRSYTQKRISPIWYIHSSRGRYGLTLAGSFSCES